jgi:hypothetical protein
MKRAGIISALLLATPIFAWAAAVPSNDRVVVKVRDDQGCPLAGANVVTIEGASGKFMRQGIIWADSNGVAVAEVAKDAILGVRVVVPGYQPFRLNLAPGAPERRGKVIEVRLEKLSKGMLIPVSN